MTTLGKAMVSILLLILLVSCGKEETANKEAAHNDEEEHQGEHEEEHEDEHSDLIELKSPEAANIEVEEVSFRSLAALLEVPGKVQFNENKLAHIGSRVPGRIVEVKANLGDKIKKGDSLAVIDSTELGETQSEYLKARANLNAQQKHYERAKKLLAGKAISLSEYQKREAEYTVVRAEYKAAEDKLMLLGLSWGELNRIISSQKISSKVNIKAPFQGTIVERHATVGEVIETATNIFTLADLSTLWVTAEVTEKDIPAIEAGAAVEITVSSYPDEVFKGVIAYVGDVIDHSSRTMKVRIDVDNSLGKLKPEMFATVKVSTTQKENVLVIPESAIQRENKNTIVFIAKSESTFKKKEVTVGPSVNGFHQVLSGLEAGEKIVTKGAFILKSELQKGEMDHGHSH